MKRAKITVIYRSGATMEFTCDEITVRRVGGTITELKWVDAKPNPLHIGVDDIAAVWEH